MPCSRAAPILMARSKTRRKNDPTATWDEMVIRNLIPMRIELAGLALFVLGSISILSLLGLTSSRWLAWWSSSWRMLLGWGAYPLFLSVIVAGIYVGGRRLGLPLRLRASRRLRTSAVTVTG